MKIDNKLILENSKSLNILYVEDDDILRESTSKLFSNFFNSVDTAVDGEDGLKKYRDYFTKTQMQYDIVISDINMPNMNGIKMCEEIKKICFEQIIIFITAFNEINYLHSAINIGINGFLTKPIEMKQLKKVLYTTTQIIADKKFMRQHYEQIEERNMIGLDLKDARKLNNASDIIDDLCENREIISHIWTGKELVHERLKSHAIDVEFFRSHYGIKVIEYFLGVIKGEAEIGNCPVIFIMLDFFKNKNLPLEDIFMICVLFKNTITGYIFDRYSFNHKLFDDINLILDKNFEGVVVNYLKLREWDKVKVQPKEPVVIEKIEEKEVFEQINYVEYVLENDVYELQDLEEDIDSLAISVIESSSATLEDNDILGNKISRYGSILSNYPLFSELGKYIMKLGENFSANAELLFNDKERMLNISALIEGFVNDLIVWRKEIFENNIENPHFLDSSFFSNVDTIIMFIEYDESAEVVDEFDDDMFF